MIRFVRGGGVEKPELLERLRRAGVEINQAARDLFADERFTTSAAPYVLETIERSVADLGLPHGGSSSRVLEQAATKGLSPCPLEAGPHLRLQFTDQAEARSNGQPTRNRAPAGSVTVASELLAVDEDSLRGFYLRRIDGTLWLRGYRCDGLHVWSPEDVFVFARGPTFPAS